MTDAGFQCRGCGSCCRAAGNVLLTERDINRLAILLDCTEQTFVDSFTALADNRACLKLVDADDGSCIFLDDRNRCSVHHAKPEQCLGFPVVWHFRNAESICEGLKGG